MLNFPPDRLKWRLEVVSILAVLGESNIKANALLICLSRTCLLPRLLPAPQGLLVERRAKALPGEYDIPVHGIYSGNIRDNLSFFANMLHGPGAGQHVCRVVKIEGKRDQESGQPCFQLRRLSPLNAIAFASFFLSVGLVVWAAAIEDGVAVVGITLMSINSPLLCIGSYWKSPPIWGLPYDEEPRGDVVFRSPGGSITVVRCGEYHARQIYFPPLALQYKVDS
jgi:hypothetical protein